jgi:hypothetical protein
MTILGLLILVVSVTLGAFGALRLAFMLIDRAQPQPKPRPRPLTPAERIAFLAEMEALDRMSHHDNHDCKHHDN